MKDQNPDVPTGTMAHPVPVTAFGAANSCAYLSAVFRAYREGRVVLSMPRSADRDTVPGVVIEAREDFTDAPGWFEETMRPIRGDEAAQISFSSGTTGTPKALLLSHRALSDVVDRINTVMEVDGTIREYVGVPVTFSFGFGRVRAVATAGGRSFLPRNGFDPAEIARMLRAGEINAISAVPTLWRVALANPEIIGKAGRNVQWIEVGSQYMAATEKEAMKRLFPNARIVQHYGLTEASRSTLLDISQTEGPILESVGRATGQVEIGLSTGGAVRVRGPHVATGLVAEDGIIPLTDDDGWLVTSDRGHIEDGFLYYDGRQDELINCGGTKIDPTRFEQQLAAALGCPDALAVGRVADPLRGEKVLVAVHRDVDLDPDALARAVRMVAETHGLAGQGAVTVRTVAEIPRTETGKVRRAALAELPDLAGHAPETAAAAVLPVADDDLVSDLQTLWSEALGVPYVAVTESFYDLGGDSLSALTLVLRMETMGLDPDMARQIFDGKTIAEIAAQASPATAGEAPTDMASEGLTLAQTLNAVHATRGLLALWVVAVHWLPGLLERISAQAIWIYTAIEPLLRFGTPGFALVFGMGIGALRLPQFAENPERYAQSARFNARLVIGGVLVFALFKFGVMWSGGHLDNPRLPSALFYSAISYYALALLAMPLILRLLLVGSNRLLTILAAAIVFMAIHEILQVTVAPLRLEGFPELIKILLTAKYGFFRMTACVLLGVAIGHVVRRHHARAGLIRDLLVAGAVIAAFGLLVAYEAHNGAILEGFGRVQPWHLTVYCGLALMLLAMFCRLGQAEGRMLHLLNAGAIGVGILALPIFVGHEIVIPAKTLIENLGVPEPIALIVPLAIFVATIGFAWLRLVRFLKR